MKRTVSVVFVLLVVASLFALTPDKVSIGIGNDLFSSGISRNCDDQLSFSVNADIEFETKKIDIDYNSITNRGWREGWSVFDETAAAADEGGSSWRNGRYDELRITGSHEFSFNKGKMLFTVNPGFGIDICGNLGSQALQNLVHKISYIHTVDIPYDIQTTVVRPVVCFDFSALYKVESFSVGPSAEIVLVPTLRAMEEVLVKAKYYALDVSAGYRFAQCWSDSDSNYTSADELYCEYLKGCVLNINFNGDFLKWNYSTSLSTNYGFGIISANVLALFEEDKNDSPLIFAAGFRRQMGWLFMTEDFLHEISDSTEFVLSCSYVAGEPENAAAEASADLTNNSREKWDNAFVMAGIRRNFNQRIASPFVSVLAGCYKTINSSIYTTISVTSKMHSVRSKVKAKAVYPCCEVNMGLEFNTHRNVAIDLFVGTSCVLNSGLKIYPYYGFNVKSK